MIAAIAPWAGVGHTSPPHPESQGHAAACLVANLNSLCVDFVARQKAQGTHLNWYIVEQLPVIAPGDYDRQFGNTTARELVRDHVLRLTYTSHDMAPFARDRLRRRLRKASRPAVQVGRGGAPAPAGPPRRPLLPPLRPGQGRRRLRPRHLPHSPPAGRGPVRPLPHPRPHPRLHERPLRRRRGDGGGSVAGRAGCRGGANRRSNGGLNAEQTMATICGTIDQDP